MGPHKAIEFADFDVYKAWQFSKYNVRRDSIFEVETFMDTHQVKQVGGAISHDPSRSQLAFHYKASVSIGLLVKEILSLWIITLMGTHHVKDEGQKLCLDASRSQWSNHKNSISGL